MARRVHRVMSSPLGPLTLVAEDGVLCGLHMVGDRNRPPQSRLGVLDRAALGEEVAQVAAYFAGELTRFTMPVAAVGTPFQRRVWERLRELRFGETVSYGQLAVRLGLDGRSARAVGAANGRNPIGIVVPCHRVVAADGGLTGYAAGLDRKRWLLDWERRSVVPGLW